MNLPWWAWVLLALLLIVVLLVLSVRQSRTRTRRAFLAYLEAEHPELEAREASATELLVKTPDGREGSLYLHNLYREAAHLEAGDEEGRRELFAHFAAVIGEGQSVFELDRDEHGSRVYPRLVAEEFITQAAAQADSGRMPSLPAGPPGLRVVFVLDSEHSVAYLTEDQLAELGLSAEEALELAKENLRGQFECEPVRKPLDDGSVSVLKSLDTYDAARLLLVPECLEEGEELGAAIPDRDTLVLAPLPADGDAAALGGMAKKAAGEPLWTRPLRVTSAGVFALD